MGLRASPGIVPSPTRAVLPPPSNLVAPFVSHPPSCLAGFPTREPSPTRLQNASRHTLNHPRYPLCSSTPCGSPVVGPLTVRTCWRVSLRFFRPCRPGAAHIPEALPGRHPIRGDQRSDHRCGTLLRQQVPLLRLHTYAHAPPHTHAHAPSLSLFAAYASHGER